MPTAVPAMAPRTVPRTGLPKIVPMVNHIATAMATDRKEITVMSFLDMLVS